MAFSEDLFFAPAHKLAAMLRKRDMSSVEMVDAFIERIESVITALMRSSPWSRSRGARGRGERSAACQARVRFGRSRAADHYQGFDYHRGRALDLGHEDV